MTLSAVTRRPSVFAAAFVAALAAGAAPAEELALKPLPREFKPQRAILRTITPPEGAAAAWHTAHFQFLSDETIAHETMQHFATTMESVPALLESPAFSLWLPRSAGRPVVRLCRDEEQFRQRGGPEGAAGFYDGRSQSILIRADLFLRPPRPGNSRLVSAPDEDLLVHELSHLALGQILGRTPPWIYEGLAEYLAAAHHGGGYYRFDNSAQAIRDHLRRYLPPNEQGKTVLSPLDRILETSGKEWIKQNTASAPADRYRPYAAALLLVHFHLEGGSARRTEFMQHLENLKTQGSRRTPRPRMETGDPSTIEARLIKYWSSRGIELRFTKP